MDPASKLRIGTSGYSFPDWVGPFYPPGTRRQEMFKGHDNTQAIIEDFRQSVEAALDVFRFFRDRTGHHGQFEKFWQTKCKAKNRFSRSMAKVQDVIERFNG